MYRVPYIIQASTSYIVIITMTTSLSGFHKHHFVFLRGIKASRSPPDHQRGCARTSSDTANETKHLRPEDSTMEER